MNGAEGVDLEQTFAPEDKKDEEFGRDGEKDSQQTDLSYIIEVNCLWTRSFKILFEYIQGYDAMLNMCLDIPVLAEMIILCDFYAMPQESLHIRFFHLAKQSDINWPVNTYKDAICNVFTKLKLPEIKHNFSML